ncbi:MAG: ribonuclease III [Steroidobacteraceae bacterium]|nr:ribonuclease III [Nevskiaceae bacterium]MCP5339658.1 ribonuclease III [Nevskiaceae bacterium]MCP5360689.1 ribonuclease III [Nevskiaceae bacterium]
MKPGWPLGWLREQLAYEPRDPALFVAALTHRSASGRNNERLEFLGDAVLNLLAADQLFRRDPLASEGDLSRLRARLVSAEPLADIALQLDLGEVLQLGSGELKTGGFRRQSILADAFEAVIGAIYLDQGLEAARRVVEPLLERQLAVAPEEPEALKDPKTRLQEWLQARALPLPAYAVEHVGGRPHEQQFYVRCSVATLDVISHGEGSSRRRAEQSAAQRLLETLTAAATRSVASDNTAGAS